MKTKLNCTITKTKNNGKFILICKENEQAPTVYYDFYSGYDIASFLEEFFAEPKPPKIEPSPFSTLPEPPTTSDEIF